MQALSQEQISAMLEQILTTLHQDILDNTKKHNNQINILNQIIESKDKQIQLLEKKLQQISKNKSQINKQIVSKHSRISRKPSKDTTQYQTEPLTPNTIKSVLSSRNIFHNPIQNQGKQIHKIASIKMIKTPRNFPPNQRENNRSNLVESAKQSKMLSSVKQKQVSTSKHQSSKSKDNLNLKMRDSSKKGKQKWNDKIEKRCINIVIPTVSFSAYQVKTPKQNSLTLN